MDNIVSLEMGRPRPARALNMPRDGARILFFTGIRYVRDEEAPARSGGEQPLHALAAVPGSERMLDAAAH